jgi:hypothetical protein
MEMPPEQKYSSNSIILQEGIKKCSLKNWNWNFKGEKVQTENCRFWCLINWQ